MLHIPRGLGSHLLVLALYVKLIHLELLSAVDSLGHEESPFCVFWWALPGLVKEVGPVLLPWNPRSTSTWLWKLWESSLPRDSTEHCCQAHAEVEATQEDCPGLDLGPF